MPLEQPTDPRSYPEWPRGLGDPYVERSDLLANNKDAKKDRRAVIAQFRAQHQLANAAFGRNPSKTNNETGAKLQPRKCSFQIQCNRAQATKKCLNCVKFDDQHLGYFCDACFEARHPSYRLPHSWESIQNDVNQDEEWMTHITRYEAACPGAWKGTSLTPTKRIHSHNLQQDAQELQLLLDQIQTHVQSNVAPASPSRTGSKPSMPITVAGTIDFQRTHASIVRIESSLHGLIGQIQSEMARKPPLTREEALLRIQSMWRIRKARKELKTLVKSLYSRFQDPATGKTYYYNTRTKTTQWTKPSALGDDELEAPGQEKSVRAKQTIPMAERFISKAELEGHVVRCIQGMARSHLARKRMQQLISSVYEKIWDDSTQRFYYHNTQTKQVSWVRPRWVIDDMLATPRTRLKQQKAAHHRLELTESEAAAMMQRAFRRKRGFRALLQLCRAVYERIYDPDQGAYYYHNTRTKETSWDKPLLLRDSESEVFTPRTRQKKLQSLLNASTMLNKPPRRVWTETDAAVELQTAFRARRARAELDRRLAQTFKKAMDSDSQQVYYVNMLTGDVSWTPPTLLLKRNTEISSFQ